MNNYYCDQRKRDIWDEMWGFMFADDGFGTLQHVQPELEDFNIAEAMRNAHQESVAWSRNP